METNIQITLTKSSTETEIKTYFKKVLELKQSGEEFPVNLELVWPLVYARKEEATRALKSEFIEDVDYQVLPKNAEQDEKQWGGNNKIDYYLSVSCMEYFIARKVRPVFEVYRQVFHHVSGKPLSVSEMFLQNAQLMVEYDRRLDAIEEKIEALASAPRYADMAQDRLHEKFDYFDELISVNELAKRIQQNGVEIGQNRLFQWLVRNHYLMVAGKRWHARRQRYDNKYIPTQDAADMRLFAISRCGHVKVTEKGVEYFLKKTYGN